MILTGASMMGKKNLLFFCLVGLFCSILFSESDIYWDFGVIIKRHGIQEEPKDLPHQNIANQDVLQATINAIITDPFIPPIRNTFKSKISDQLDNELSSKLITQNPEKYIFRIESMVNNSYLKKNYLNVIELLNLRNLSMLPEQRRCDLEYLLADSFYQAGDYKKARDHVLVLLKQNESDKFYLLLAMIYESLGKNNEAKEYYLKLIAQYPNSDYFISAQIKSRILSQH